MVVLDATMLMLLIQPDVATPRMPTGEPIEHAAERVRRLIADFETQAVVVAIPTPALAEVLVRVSPKAAAQIVERIGRYWALRIVPFDARAAIEVAAMMREAFAGGYGKRDGDGTWAKLKYDRQIVAIAKVNSASTIYSDDADVRRIAARVDLEVIGVADLPAPAKDAEQAKVSESARPSQMDLLGGDLEA